MKSPEFHSAYLKKNKLQLRDIGLTEIGFSVYLKWASFHCHTGSTRTRPTRSPSSSVHRMRTVKTQRLLRSFFDSIDLVCSIRLSILVGCFSIVCYRILQETTIQVKKQKVHFSVTSSNDKARCNHHSHRYHGNGLSVLTRTTSRGLLESEQASQYLEKTPQISISAVEIYHTHATKPLSASTSYKAHEPSPPGLRSELCSEDA